MLTVGDRIPNFDVQAVVSTDVEKAFARLTSSACAIAAAANRRAASGDGAPWNNCPAGCEVVRI
jgi:hypothetical protein